MKRTILVLLVLVNLFSISKAYGWVDEGGRPPLLEPEIVGQAPVITPPPAEPGVVAEAPVITPPPAEPVVVAEPPVITPPPGEPVVVAEPPVKVIPGCEVEQEQVIYRREILIPEINEINETIKDFNTVLEWIESTLKQPIGDQYRRILHLMRKGLLPQINALIAKRKNLSDELESAEQAYNRCLEEVHGKEKKKKGPFEKA